MRLVADIGGTNSRLALSHSGKVLQETIQSYVNADWDDLYAVISHYLGRAEITQPHQIVIAVAGPVQGGRASLTNRDWLVEAPRLKEVFGVDAVHLLNDLTALGYSVPKLQNHQLKLVSAGTPSQAALSQSIVVGIGTGFNASPVLETAGVVICPPIEAGHISMPHHISKRLRDLGFPDDRFDTVEALFSGRGFSAFCQELSGRKDIAGQAIMAAYNAPDQERVTVAIEMYSSLLGYLLRELSLAYMPSSGIYLAGSVARSVIGTVAGPCLEVLRQPFTVNAAHDTPVWMIQDDIAALLGCADFAFR